MTTAALPVQSGARSIARVVKAGLVAGALDLCLAMLIQLVFVGRVNLVRVFQSVASGVLGASARTGGPPAAALGLVLHFLIATIWAAIFLVVAYRWSSLRRWTQSPPSLVATGLGYGVVIWGGMNLVVVPLSRATSNLSLSLVTLAMIAGHAVMVGLPMVLTIGRVREPGRA